VSTVRKLGLNDAQAWASLRCEALEAHPLAFSAAMPGDANQLVQSILPRLDPGAESAVFGGFTGGILIGIVGIVRSAGLKERHKAIIWGMYVTPASRRTGTGGMLLRAAIQHGRYWSGVEQIHLSVSEVASDAKRLYERHGFREWGCEPRALCWQGRYADETHMILYLTDESA
jgi:GNAT superfamily N-acetyltransferase